MVMTAILVDGGFYRKRAKHQWGIKTAEERAKELNAYCHAHINKKDGPATRQLYRIFYYDCEPSKRSVYHPLTKQNIELDKSDTCCTARIQFYCVLTRMAPGCIIIVMEQPSSHIRHMSIFSMNPQTDMMRFLFRSPSGIRRMG